MASNAPKAVLLAIAILLLCGCASGPATKDLAVVSGCVEVIEPPPSPQCVIVELHEFRPGILWVPGSYVRIRHQPLAPDGCFAFEVAHGREVSIKTRDSDRILVGGAEYVVAGQSSTGIAVSHGRASAEVADSTQRHCGHPAIDAERSSRQRSRARQASD